MMLVGGKTKREDIRVSIFGILSARIVMIYHLLQGVEPAIVHIGSRQGNIAQGRCSEFAVSRIYCRLWGHGQGPESLQGKVLHPTRY